MFAAVERVASEAAVRHRDPARHADRLEQLERRTVLGLRAVQVAEAAVDQGKVVLGPTDPGWIAQALLDLEPARVGVDRLRVAGLPPVGDPHVGEDSRLRQWIAEPLEEREAPLVPAQAIADVASQDVDRAQLLVRLRDARVRARSAGTHDRLLEHLAGSIEASLVPLRLRHLQQHDRAFPIGFLGEARQLVRKDLQRARALATDP